MKNEKRWGCKASKNYAPEAHQPTAEKCKIKKGGVIQYDIQERTFSFGVQIIKLAGKIPGARVAKVVSNQVLRSVTSIGATVEEAQAAHTKNAFTYEMNIALSETRETHYWLRLLVN
jgi:four helix bundle protein